MKKKVLFSIVGIALFAITIAFNTNTEANQQQKEANVEAISEANAYKPPQDTRCMKYDGPCSLTDDDGWYGYR
jgi:hypothetical protein